MLPCPGSLLPRCAAHQGNQPGRDRQPQPRAAETPCGGGIGLGERLEDAIEVVPRNSNARIPDGKLQVNFLGRERLDSNGHRHFAAVGEFDRVSGQVQEHLPQPHLVADDGVRQVLGHAARERQTFLARPQGEHSRGLIQNAAQAERDGLQLQFPRFDLRRVKQIVQQAEQMVRRLQGRVQAIRIIASDSFRSASSTIPRMAFIGVRSSWLTFARNWLLASLAASASAARRSATRAISVAIPRPSCDR